MQGIVLHGRRAGLRREGRHALGGGTGLSAAGSSVTAVAASSPSAPSASSARCHQRGAQPCAAGPLQCEVRLKACLGVRRRRKKVSASAGSARRSSGVPAAGQPDAHRREHSAACRGASSCTFMRSAPRPPWRWAASAGRRPLPLASASSASYRARPRGSAASPTVGSGRRCRLPRWAA